MRLNTESRQTIQRAINFIFAPAPSLEPLKVVDFMKSLQEEGLEFQSSNRSQTRVDLERTDRPLKLSLGVVGPQVAQILLSAEDPVSDLILFEKEFDSVCRAYVSVWQQPLQLLLRDATLTCLYACDDCDHSFKYLWQHLLGQEGSEFGQLGKPILGGGLRFVMPPTPDEKPEPTTVEVKVESFLRDTSKLFVQTQFVWPQPTGSEFFGKSHELLQRIEDYVDKKVIPFIAHQKGNP
jgi:hypothetical protein